MYFYIVFTLVLLIPICLPYNRISDFTMEKKKEVSLAVSMLMILLVSGLRAITVGADSRQYASAYDQLKILSIKKALSVPIWSWNGTYTYSLEFGYRIYNKMVAFFFDSNQAILFFNSLIIVILLYNLIRRNSPYYGLSIWLYITLGFFQTEMNMARNAMAILFCLNAIECIYKRELFKYILLVLLASTFHTSALLFIPLYWVINYIELTPRRIKIFALLSVVVGLLGQQVYYFLLIFVPSRYLHYMILAESETEGTALVFLFIGVFLLIWFFCDEKYDVDSFISIDNAGAWLFILMVFSFSISRSINAFTRVAALFSPYLIIYFPEMICYGISNKWVRRIIVVTLVVGLFGVYVYRLSINNIGQTIPYHFFWDNTPY